MDLQLSGKTALVTGSTAGIGHAIAATLLGEGARVIVNGRTQARVEAAIAAFPPGSRDRAIGLAADVSKADGVAQAIERQPDVDILINNMGIFEPKPFAEITDADWFRFFEANVMSGVRLSRHYVPRMIASGWGRIIFISSESAIQIPAEMIHYGMTKTAQLAISRGLAETTAGTGVTVNSVLPGPTKSEGVMAFVDQLARDQKVDTAVLEKEFFQSARPTSLLRRFETPEEVAAMVAFVASPLSSGTNGAALRVDGGVVRSLV
ncbi:SDR family NAD(P)-dependent oxidoreductase [Nevskia soli]|jgi:NAD(P)-dependent dehydrogenase (short-subunit alcohol dehydrogenase family)|uniref:SDR family NAD(P)-dependent oxidoreductase n=1 Tax=Nevskia soli TaxID=418856 RepID=UPI0015D777DF|nr:SDR family oxidoreductase [Nevskia soli]